MEPIDEYQIQEISYDGQEKYIQPPTMSENLAQLIRKIDFKQPIEELEEEFKQTTKEDVLPRPQTGTSWIFDPIRNKLRSALGEICALHDILLIAKEKKYMVFDVVTTQKTDHRAIISLLARKTALQNASQILLDGTSVLKSPENSPDFYQELKEMRRNWPLKRFNNNIIGDLSFFRPAGYWFTPNTRFEVIKTTQGSRGFNNQALAVKIPNYREGEAHIQVSIIRDDDVALLDLAASASGIIYEISRDGTWQQRLESAQNVLFCKELFRHLAKEAVQYKFVIPTTVTGNRIIMALFPNTKLYITLMHKTPNTKCGVKKLQKDHKFVLEHSLHHMFREFYSNMFKRASRECLLDKIVEQAQHLIMRHQTMEVIDSFAAKIKDPMIISHWFCLNSPTTSIVRVDIVSNNNEILGRSHMLINIGTRQLRVITRDCKNLVLGYEPEELRHLLIWQSCLHQFIASDKLSKLLGWYTMILNYNINVTRKDLSSSAFSLAICSSNCTHMISIKSGPQFGLTVDVAQFKDPSTIMRSLSDGSDLSPRNNATCIESIIDDDSHDKQLSRLQDLVDNFREVDWDKMYGRDFLTKLELLMAALTANI